jgi:hypothetical protein
LQLVRIAALVLTPCAGPALEQEPSSAQAQIVPEWAAPTFASRALADDDALLQPSAAALRAAA